MPPFIENIDLSILRAVESLDAPPLDIFARALSLLCEHGILPLLLAAALIIPKATRRTGITVLAALALSMIVTNLTLKPLVARPRPYERYDFVVTAPLPHDSSFPSGHTSAAFAAAVGFATTERRRFKKWSVAAVIVAALVGLSRIWLMVHYPSDVLVGAIVGTLCGIVASLAVRPIYEKFTGSREA